MEFAAAGAGCSLWLGSAVRLETSPFGRRHEATTRKAGPPLMQERRQPLMLEKPGAPQIKSPGSHSFRLDHGRQAICKAEVGGCNSTSFKKLHTQIN